MLDMVASYSESLTTTLHGTKHKIDDANLGALWHRRLSHISKNKVEWLVSNGILDSIDFANFDVYVEYIKGKQTKIMRLGAYRATYVLELIHTNICGSFLTPSWNGQQYFIWFIVDYYRYAYIYLIHEKSQSLDVLKWFKAKVDN